MSTQYTPKLGLGYWQLNDPNWHLPFQADMQLLDALAALGAFAAAAAEHPSTTLNVTVAAGVYLRQDGTKATYAGGVAVLPASSTQSIWLNDSGALTLGSSYPSTPHLPIATVTSNPTTIATIDDDRVAYRMTSAGPRSGTVALAGGTATVAATWLTASSVVVTGRMTSGGTPGFLSLVGTAGVGFTVNSSSGSDTSTIGWIALEP